MIHGNAPRAATPPGLAASGRPCNYAELAELSERWDEELAWSEFLHEFFRYKSASFFAVPPLASVRTEQAALLAGVAEFLSLKFGLVVPAWVNEPEFFLADVWDPWEDICPDMEEKAFGGDADYAKLHKIYGASEANESRYSSATCIGWDMKTVSDVPDPKDVSTSYVERQNLNMRMSMRRFTRQTNAFSKKVENHGHAVALYFAFYNFCRVHQTLRVTPAMEAGLSDHVWTVEELVSLMPEPEAKKRGAYKKRKDYMPV